MFPVLEQNEEGVENGCRRHDSRWIWDVMGMKADTFYMCEDM